MSTVSAGKNPVVKCVGSLVLHIIESDGSSGGFDAIEYLPALVLRGLAEGEAQRVGNDGVELGWWEHESLSVSVDGTVIEAERALALAETGLRAVLRETLQRI